MVALPPFDAAVRNYVFSVAMKYVKDEDAAADVAQDALLLAHRHRASFRGDSQFSTWMYRITATSALMYLRRQRRLSREVPSTITDDDEGTGIIESRPSPTPDPADSLAGRQVMRAIADGVSRLGDKYGPIFWMRYLEGYTETEIAERLGLSLATVKTRAHRARLAARAHLEANAVPQAA
jgi:RNA polymerase sigma-70 factor (ECF subfamily)